MIHTLGKNNHVDVFIVPFDTLTTCFQNWEGPLIFKTLEFFRRIGVKNLPNLSRDSNKEIETGGSRSEKL